MRHVVLHREDVEFWKDNPAATSGLRARATEAHRVIEDLLARVPDVIRLDRHRKGIREVGDAPKHSINDLKPGEEVMLYGAYHGMGLSQLYGSLIIRGMKPRYNERGFI